MRVGTLNVAKDIFLTKEEKLNNIEKIKSELNGIANMFDNISPENQELMFSNIIAAFLVMSQKLVMIGMPSSESDPVANNFSAVLERLSGFLENRFDLDQVRESAIFINNIKNHIQPSEIVHMRLFSGPYAEEFISKADLKLEVLKQYLDGSTEAETVESSFKEMHVVDGLKSLKKISSELSIKEKADIHKNKFSLRNFINNINVKRALLILGACMILVSAFVFVGPILVPKLAILMMFLFNSNIMIMLLLLVAVAAMLAFILIFNAGGIPKDKGYPVVKYWLDQFLSSIRNLAGIKFRDENINENK